MPCCGPSSKRRQRKSANRERLASGSLPERAAQDCVTGAQHVLLPDQGASLWRQVSRPKSPDWAGLRASQGALWLSADYGVNSDLKLIQFFREQRFKTD